MDKLLLLSDARDLIPGRPCKNTVWSWVRHGLKSPGGQRIKLPHSQVGGRIFTTAADVEAFLGEVAAAGSKHFSQTPQKNRARVISGAEAPRRRAGK